MEGQSQRVDLVATLDRLKQENESLKQQLADVKAGRGLSALPGTGEAALLPVTPVHTTAPSNSINFTVDTVPTVRTRPAPVISPRSTQTQAVTPSSPRQAAPAPATTTGTRKHIIRPGDTLSKLAQQYYNNRAKWRDIYAANRNVMKNESDLKVGTELKLP